MSKGKIFGYSALIYVLLNILFIFLYGLVGLSIGFGDMFSYIGGNINGFLITILSPGGRDADIFGGMYSHMQIMDSIDFVLGFIGFLWALIPGLIAALVAGLKLSEESAKDSFLSVFLMIFSLTTITLIIIAAWAPVIFDAFTIGFVPIMSISPSGALGYLTIPFVGAFNGVFFGGIAAISSSSL